MLDIFVREYYTYLPVVAGCTVVGIVSTVTYRGRKSPGVRREWWSTRVIWEHHVRNEHFNATRLFWLIWVVKFVSFT